MASYPDNLNPFITNQPTRKENSYGVAYLRGSQYSTMSFPDAVMASYSNLVYHPITLLSFAVLIFVCIAESGDGPLEVFKSYLIKFIADKSNPEFLINLANFLVKVDDFLITNKLLAVKVGMIMVPCMSKPSSKTIITGSIISVLVVLLPEWSFFEALVIGQLWFLFLQLRSPYHKIFVVAIGALLYLFPILVSPKPKPTPTPPTMPTPPTRRN